MKSWGFAVSFVEKLRFEIDREWRGELPMTVPVFTSGNRESPIGPLSRQDIGAWLAPAR